MAPWNPFVEVRLTDSALAVLDSGRPTESPHHPLSPMACVCCTHSCGLLHIAQCYAFCRLCSRRGHADALASGGGA